MSAQDLTVGYPAHAVSTFRKWTTEHGVRITDWTAICGATDREVGSRPFGLSGSARKLELCRKCFPAFHATIIPKPTELP